MLTPRRDQYPILTGIVTIRSCWNQEDLTENRKGGMLESKKGHAVHDDFVKDVAAVPASVAR